MIIKISPRNRNVASQYTSIMAKYAEQDRIRWHTFSHIKRDNQVFPNQWDQFWPRLSRVGNMGTQCMTVLENWVQFDLLHQASETRVSIALSLKSLPRWQSRRRWSGKERGIGRTGRLSPSQFTTRKHLGALTTSWNFDSFYSRERTANIKKEIELLIENTNEGYRNR